MKGTQPNKALVAGARYAIRWRSPNLRRDRLDVLDYLGDNYTNRSGGEYVFSARPIAGTQAIPIDWVISMERVASSTPIQIGRVAIP